MKKLLLALLSTFTVQTTLAATRAPAAAAPSTSATPSTSGNWMMGDHTRGLTVSKATGTADDTTVGFTIFRNDTDSYRLGFGLAVNNVGPGDANFGFSIDFGYRMYQFVSGSLKGFTQPGAIFGKLNNGQGFSDDAFLGFYYKFGAEYFFNPNLALGAMAGVALNMTNGLKDMTFGTSTSAVFLSYYW